MPVNALLDIDALPYEIAVRPAIPRLLAWEKLEETERRWSAFEWLAHEVRAPGRNQRFFDDLASAFLYSFEATLELLRTDLQMKSAPFGTWLKRRPEYDLRTRGLRTLPILEAHLRPGRLGIRHGGITHTRFAGGVHPSDVPTRYFPVITNGEFAAIEAPKLLASELGAWNALTRERSALDLMREGLRELTALVRAAE